MTITPPDGSQPDDDRLESIFWAAVEKPTPEARNAYLDQVCAGSPKLRKNLDGLLAAHDRAEGFMESTGADTESPVPKPEGLARIGSHVGPYRLLRVIGEGGMGTVYMAEQDQPVERRVALKLIRRGMDSKEVIARFAAERQALALMDHPNIASVFDAGTTKGGRPYFAMELVKGVPITTYCRENALDLRQRLELFVKVCHAVQHAHQKGVIHRDLKPANILVAEYDGERAPKVIDFGVAKATRHTLTMQTMHTQLGQILGTFEYMSPEQAQLNENDVDTRSDIYSLGVVLYELLTGTTPFERARLRAAGFQEMLKILREEEPPRPSKRLEIVAGETAPSANTFGDTRALSRQTNGELDWIAMRALDKDRSQRYESAAALAADVERYLSDETVHACPPSAGYRLRKFARRHRGPVAAATALLVALLLGLAGTAAGLVQARRAESRSLRAQAGQQRITFTMALERGLSMCNEGHVGGGMLWLGRALELCPSDEPDLQRVVRANLSAWRRELHTVEAMFPHREPVVGVAFSPDDRTLLTASNDDTAQLWDIETVSRIRGPMTHSGDGHEAVFSSDGSLLLTSDYGSTAFLWDGETGERLHTLEHLGRLVPGAAFRPPDDEQVVTSGGREVKIWDVRTGALVGQLDVHPHLVHDVAVSDDGTRIVTGCHDRNVRIWDFESRALLAVLSHETRVPSADFLGAHNSRVVTGDANGTLFLWDVTDAEPGPEGVVMRSVADHGYVGGPWRHQGTVHRVRSNPDGTRFLSASFDNTARMWDPHAGAVGAPFEHAGPVQTATFAWSGDLIATACDDNAARIWRPARGRGVRRVVLPTTAEHEGVYSPDGRLLISEEEAEDVPGEERALIIRDVETGDLVCRLPGQGATRDLVMSRDGRLILLGGADQEARLIEAATGESVMAPIDHPSEVFAVDISPDGTKTLSADFDGMVRVFDIETEAEIWSRSVGSRVMSARFSPDGRRLAVGCGDKCVHVFDASTAGPPLLTLQGHQSTVTAIAFSPDGTRIVAASHDNTVRVWDAKTGEPLAQSMAHQGPIWYPVAVAVSPDGSTIATGCDDHTARVWDLATGKPIGPAIEHEAGVRLVAFSDDGEIRTGTATGITRFWTPTLAPVEGEVERIQLWLEVCAGLELGSDGALETLDAAAWERRRLELTERGGPPATR